MVGDMTEYNVKMKKEICHDFMAEKKWLIVIMGFGKSTSKFYDVYIAVLFGYFLYHIGMNIYGMVLLSGDKILTLDAVHVLMNSVFTVWGMTTRVLTDKALEKIRAYINSGFYTYEEEDLFDEQLEMRERAVEEVRMRSRDFIYIWMVGGFTIVIFYPVSQVILVTNEEYERVVDLGNPYLPAFFHMPFDTRPAVGLAAAFLIALIFYIYVVGAAMVMNEIYLSSVMQLRVQLRILNYSIRHIHTRASLMYQKKYKFPRKEISLDDILEDSLYQHCVNICLRSNVEHHQALLRFNQEVLRFSGSFLLLMVNVASITFASHLYIIMQNPSLNLSIKCLVMLLVEQTYTLYLCVFGEIVMRESASLFESLYSVPWFYYSKAFNQTLTVFMSCTLKPMRVKSLLLDFTASLETYANNLILIVYYFPLVSISYVQNSEHLEAVRYYIILFRLHQTKPNQADKLRQLQILYNYCSPFLHINEKQ